MNKQINVTAATKDPIVYSKCTAQEIKEPTPIEKCEWEMKWLEKEIKSMIRSAKEWGEDLTNNDRFKYLKDEYALAKAQLEEAKRTWKPEQHYFTTEDLVARFGRK